MKSSNDYYLNNPLIHKDRRLGQSPSAWVRSFDCTDVQPLIICRGPIRKEAMDVFDEMGMAHYGILISEKDSIVYQNALAPELRILTDPNRVHRVPDYSGVDKDEREQRIKQIIRIAKENGYNAVFAGYGFMAEDETLVRALEEAGLNFIGPCSQTVHGAGFKDEAKRTALNVGVSVTPGIDNLTALTLLNQYPDLAALKSLVEQHGLIVHQLDDAELSLADKADLVLNAAYQQGVDLYTIEELGEQAGKSVAQMFEDYPQNRVRLKAIGGGGGKGQRILAAPSSYSGDPASRIQQAASKAPGLIREILSEVKATGVGDNKNVLLELNIETTRHLEIQVIGNGAWALSLGGRDCSLQMHEQKLLEISVIHEELENAIQVKEQAGKSEEAHILRQESTTLEAMEREAERFGQAVGLDSASTFECIVDRDQHFFMEMNTRIQVEHRVTELCYKLKFINPDNPNDFFEVESLVEAMVLLARHGKRLPKPERLLRHEASIEARLNATNQSLTPHAGGVIEAWSDPIEDEIRDDQGICVHNPDTDVFMKYTLAGAYDSNIALILTVGQTRLETFQKLSEILRCAILEGKDLATNLEFHYGLVNWLIGQNENARPTTGFILPYLTAIGLLKQEADRIDRAYAYQQIKASLLKQCSSDEEAKALAYVIDRKLLLLLRPIEKLLEKPHLLAGWLSIYEKHFREDSGKMVWTTNPISILEDTYRFLNMDYQEEVPPAYMIWDHDQTILNDAVNFYAALDEKLGGLPFSQLHERLITGDAPEGISPDQWEAAQAAHRGYQAGTEILLVLPFLAKSTHFYDLTVNEDLTIHLPEPLKEASLQEAMKKVLVPPPVAKSDEILAASGGMYYPREAPGMEVYVKKGSHFNEGDPLYIVEVMKMFNKVYAPFSGTIDDVLIEGDGVIIKKGQPLFKITPDEKIVEESPEAIQQRIQEKTALFLQNVLPESLRN